MEEPERFRKDSMKNARIPYTLIFRRYGTRLAAISATWYLLRCICDLDAAGSFHSLGFCTISSRKSLLLVLLNPLTLFLISVIQFVSFLGWKKVFLICQVPYSSESTPRSSLTSEDILA